MDERALIRQCRGDRDCAGFFVKVGWIFFDRAGAELGFVARPGLEVEIAVRVVLEVAGAGGVGVERPEEGSFLGVIAFPGQELEFVDVCVFRVLVAVGDGQVAVFVNRDAAGSDRNRFLGPRVQPPCSQRVRFAVAFFEFEGMFHDRHAFEGGVGPFAGGQKDRTPPLGLGTSPPGQHVVMLSDPPM